MNKTTIISNISTRTNHLEALRNLFTPDTIRIVIVSPFLASQIKSLLDEFKYSDITQIDLITTCKPNDPEQLTKPNILKETCDFFQQNYPKINLKIHLNNKLHGKLYFAIRPENKAMILSSANFTRNGLINNHEWGVETYDKDIIDDTLDEIFNTIEKAELTYNQIVKACSFVDQYNKMNPEWQKKPNIICDIMETIYSDENIKNPNPQYFLKPIGHKDSPIKISDKRDFSALHQNLHFSKKKPKGVRKGDMLITTAIGAGSLLSYFTVIGGLECVSEDEKKEDPWKERWPYFMEGRNQSVAFGKKWWKYNLRRQDLVEEFTELYPNVPVTSAGGYTLNTINRGADKVRITKEFAEFLIDKINSQ